MNSPDPYEGYDGLRDVRDAETWIYELRGLTPPADPEPAADAVIVESDEEPRLGVPYATRLAVQTEAATAPESPESESRMFTAKFWKNAAERAIKTFAQTMVAALTVDAAGIMHADWSAMATLAASAAVASVLTTLAGVSGPAREATDGASDR